MDIKSNKFYLKSCQDLAIIMTDLDLIDTIESADPLAQMRGEAVDHDQEIINLDEIAQDQTKKIQ